MKFKKLAALTLAGAMSLSLAACGGGPLRRHRYPRA